MTKNVANDALENVSKELATASSNQYLDLLQQVLSGTVTEVTEDQYNEILNLTSIKPDEQIEQTKFLLSHKDVGFMPEDGVMAIKARAKNGKSFLCTILSASLLGCTDFGLFTNKPDAKVLYIDTEQRKYNAQMIAKRVNVLLGKNPVEPNDRFVVIHASQFSKIQRLNLFRFYASTKKFDAIFIDGIVDLCDNFNDVKESQDLIEEIKNKAQEYKMNVAGVLHKNKSKEDDTMRGHLGGEFVNKCDDCIQVTKKNDIYEVEFTDQKNAPVEGFKFIIDNNGIPRNADSLQQQMKAIADYQKQQEKVKELRVMFKSLYKYEEEEEGLTSTDLKKRFIQKGHGKDAKFFRCLSDACNYGILYLEGEKLYKFNNNLE